MELLMPLDARHEAAVTAHLLSLSPDDRLNRFSVTADDGYVRRYAGGIGHARDILLGALQGRKLVGLAHAAVYVEHGDLVTEIGVSVDAGARKLGLGKRLLLGAMEAARRFKVCRMYVLFRTTNTAMAALTRSLGGRVESDGGESSAVFEFGASRELPLAVHRGRQGSEVQ